MPIKRCALALAVTAALSTAAVTGATNLRADTKPVGRTSASPRHVTPHFRFPNRLRPADTVLYSQMGTVDSGAVSQDMQAALDTSDALAADDFVVPAGGVAMLNALAGPLPDVTFCPTGGITPETAPSFLACRNVACVGGSWLTPRSAIEAGDWDAITALAAAASRLRQA